MRWTTSRNVARWVLGGRAADVPTGWSFILWTACEWAILAEYFTHE